MAFTSFLVIEEREKKKTELCVCIYCKSHSGQSCFFFFHRRTHNSHRDGYYSILQPKYFWNRGAFAFIARHCVVSIQPVFLAACPRRVIERLSENALHSSPNKPQSDTIPKVTSASRSPFSGGKKEKKRKHAFKLIMP